MIIANLCHRDYCLEKWVLLLTTVSNNKTKKYTLLSLRIFLVVFLIMFDELKN